MKIIVPVKDDSSRLRNKNFVEFHIDLREDFELAQWYYERKME